MFNNAGINKVFLVGYVGKTPSLSRQPDGQNFYCFPLATNEFIKKQNRLVEHTEWHQIKVPEHQFKSVLPQLDKGHLIYLEGKITSRAFVDEQGVKRYRSDVVSTVFRVLTNSSFTDHANHLHA
jgi:single-strand DNA-binding protein